MNDSDSTQTISYMRKWRYRQWLEAYTEDQVREAWRHQRTVKFVNTDMDAEGLFNPGSLQHLVGNYLKKQLYAESLLTFWNYARNSRKLDRTAEKLRSDCLQIRSERFEAFFNRVKELYHD